MNPIAKIERLLRCARRTGRTAAVVALCVAMAPPIAMAQLPTLGDSGDLTTGAERKLG